MVAEHHGKGEVDAWFGTTASRLKKASCQTLFQTVEQVVDYYNKDFQSKILAVRCITGHYLCTDEFGNDRLGEVNEIL